MQLRPTPTSSVAYKEATGVEAVEVLYKNAPDFQLAKNDPAAKSTSPSTIRSSTGWRSNAKAGCATCCSVDRKAPSVRAGNFVDGGIRRAVDLNLWWGVMVQKKRPKPIRQDQRLVPKQIVEQATEVPRSPGADPHRPHPEEAQALFPKAIPEWGAYVGVSAEYPAGLTSGYTLP